MKVVLITGTRKGIGKSLCEHFLNKGYFVGGCARGKSSISHKNYRHFELDVKDEKSVVFMVKSLIKEFECIDILINNAGIASMNHLLLTPTSTIDKIFDTNFKGSFLFLREVAKTMSLAFKKNSSTQFRIVNFATVATPLNLEGEAIYAASKAAIESLTKIASKELAQFNVRVNAVAPTPIRTDLIKNVGEEKMQSLLNRQAIKRYGEFDDVINVIDFFCDDKSDFITGQIIYLGGINQ